MPDTDDHPSRTGELALTTGLENIRTLVLHGLESDHSKRSYARSIDRFLDWWMRKQPRPILNRALMLEYRDARRRQVSAASVNLELSALRRLAVEAADAGLISHEQSHQINSVKGIKTRGVRLGNWMTLDALRNYVPTPGLSLTEKRDRAILAVLAGCGLRRTELASLSVAHLQFRDDRPVFLDIKGKGAKLRTVAIPAWVFEILTEWREEAGLLQAKTGPLFRRLTNLGKLTEEPISDKTVYKISTRRSRTLRVEIAPHDLRRTCAKLCREHGGRLEDIQAMLGHASLTTTQRYLGDKINLKAAPNDLFQL